MIAKDPAGGEFTVETDLGSQLPVLIALGDDTIVSVPAEAKAIVVEEEPGSFSVSNDESSQAPIIAIVGGQEIEVQPGETGVDIQIDIKPDDATNAINLGSNGNIPVAILSSASFDAQDVDPITVTLAGAVLS